MVDISTQQRAVEMYSEGGSAQAVAQALGISKATVTRWARAAGVIRTMSETRGCTDDVKQKAVEMYSEGGSALVVAKALGIGTTAVLRWARAAGVIRTISEAQSTGGYITDQGYRSIQRNGRPIFLHREIAESILARPLTSLEVVHHVNGCRSDNRPANLWVFPTHADHTVFHRTGIVHPDTIKLVPYCGEVA